MKALSPPSDFPANVLCACPGMGSLRPTSSSLPIEVSVLSVPVREINGGAPEGGPDGGWAIWISFETTTRPVPTSHSKSHDPEVSKIGFVTPAIYAGLRADTAQRQGISSSRDREKKRHAH